MTEGLLRLQTYTIQLIFAIVILVFLPVFAAMNCADTHAVGGTILITIFSIALYWNTEVDQPRCASEVRQEWCPKQNDWILRRDMSLTISNFHEEHTRDE